MSDQEKAEWDKRYSTSERIWSGNPNGALVDEVAGLAPGRALDVGCGEGADAVWLAKQGWQVTAVDVSEVALERATQHAADAGVDVTWICASLVDADVPPTAFDLVTAQYPALLRTPAHDSERAVLDAVAPGGVLLFVHHVHMEAKHDHDTEFDPANYVFRAQILNALDAQWQVTVDERRQRHVSTGAGAGHTEDDVLRVIRLS